MGYGPAREYLAQETPVTIPVAGPGVRVRLGRLCNADGWPDINGAYVDTGAAPGNAIVHVGPSENGKYFELDQVAVLVAEPEGSITLRKAGNAGVPVVVQELIPGGSIEPIAVRPHYCAVCHQVRTDA